MFPHRRCVIEAHWAECFNQFPRSSSVPEATQKAEKSKHPKKVAEKVKCIDICPVNLYFVFGRILSNRAKRCLILSSRQSRCIWFCSALQSFIVGRNRVRHRVMCFLPRPVALCIPTIDKRQYNCAPYSVARFGQKNFSLFAHRQKANSLHEAAAERTNSSSSGLCSVKHKSKLKCCTKAKGKWMQQQHQQRAGEKIMQRP